MWEEPYVSNYLFSLFFLLKLKFVLHFQELVDYVLRKSDLINVRKQRILFLKFEILFKIRNVNKVKFPQDVIDRVFFALGALG